MKFLLTVSICLSFFQVYSQQNSYIKIRSEFITTIRAFNLPPLQLDFKQNLQSLSSQKNQEEQWLFFTNMDKKLKAIDIKTVNDSLHLDYILMKYETALNIKRLKVQKKATPDTYSNKSGLSQLTNGKKWYEYFLSRWVDLSVTPMEIFNLGKQQTKRAADQIHRIRRERKISEEAFSAMLDSDTFYLKEITAVTTVFEKMKVIVQGNLSNVFFDYKFPGVNIERGTNEALKQTPGYYSNNTFYFNYFDEPYNKRQVDWLYLHEAVPGHHFQSSIAGGLEESDVQQLFSYFGYSEGWAAYVEEIGKDLGAYLTWYTELGKWEWDLIRSMRLVLDVGINYLNWSDKKAMEYWHTYLTGKDKIAEREIARVKRWPAQAVTYKYGAFKIMQWKEKMLRRNPGKFNIKKFHHDILKHGALPFSLLEDLIFK